MSHGPNLDRGHPTFTYLRGSDINSGRPRTLVTFIRKKRVGNNVYLYEVQSVRNSDGSWSQRVVRYIGPVDPVYGGKGPANIDEERERIAARDARRQRI